VLEYEVETVIIVKKKGQTTIPVRIRKKLKIEEGTRLEIVETDGSILLKPKKSIWAMIGAFSDQASVEQMNQLHYKLRHEEENE
jgi:AbrB family looped-hinge helix DNA binding protein